MRKLVLGRRLSRRLLSSEPLKPARDHDADASPKSERCQKHAKHAQLQRRLWLLGFPNHLAHPDTQQPAGMEHERRRDRNAMAVFAAMRKRLRTRRDRAYLGLSRVKRILASSFASVESGALPAGTPLRFKI